MNSRTWLRAGVWGLAMVWFAAGWAPAQEEGGRGPRGAKNRPDKAPKQGEVAPDFTLKTLDGEREVNLTEERKKQPVVLIFGSYT